MPFIHIKSLPFDVPLDIAPVIEGLCHDFAEATGIELKHVHATWEYLQPGHYAVAGEARDRQPKNSHPVLIDLLTPDFNEAETIKIMLNSVAASLSRRAKISQNNIFINHRHAHSGMVFDSGEVVSW